MKKVATALATFFLLIGKELEEKEQRSNEKQDIVEKMYLPFHLRKS